MLIEAHGLGRSFGATVAVASVSFDVPAGQIVGILGPNGAGKSTTLRMLAGTLRPASGTARIAGIDVGVHPEEARHRVGYLPEAANGFADLSVAEFLLVAARGHGFARARGDAAVARVMRVLDLVLVASRPLSTLSKGWRQRAWLGQALIHDPPVLLLDEPTDGLDPSQKESMRRLLKSIAPERAILMSTHILEEAEALCDRAIVIAQGRVVADSPIASLLDASGRLAPAVLRLTTSSAEAPA
ncbi:MAG: ABC transporter ATP-binding protein [Hyphomicrobiaceae bacterium]